MSVQKTKDTKEEKPEEIKPEETKSEQVKKTRSRKNINSKAKTGSVTTKKATVPKRTVAPKNAVVSKSVGNSSGSKEKTSVTGHTEKIAAKKSDSVDTDKNVNADTEIKNEVKSEKNPDRRKKTSEEPVKKEQRKSSVSDRRKKTPTEPVKNERRKSSAPDIAAPVKPAAEKETKPGETSDRRRKTSEGSVKPERRRSSVSDRRKKTPAEPVKNERRKSSMPDIVEPVSAADIEIDTSKLENAEVPQIFDFDDAIITDEDEKPPKADTAKAAEAEPEVVDEAIADETVEALEPEAIPEEIIEEVTEKVAEKAVEVTEPEDITGEVAEEVAEEAVEVTEPEIAVEEEASEEPEPEVLADEAAEISEPDVETPEPEIAAEGGSFFTKLFSGFLKKKDKQAEAPETVAKEVAEEAAEAPEPETAAEVVTEETVEEAAETLAQEIATEVVEEAVETPEPEIAIEEYAVEVSEALETTEETPEPEIAAEGGNFFTKLVAGFLKKKDKQIETAETVAEETVEEAAEVPAPGTAAEEVVEEAAEAPEPEIAAEESVEEVVEEVSEPLKAIDETPEPEIAAEGGNFFTKLLAGFLKKKDKQAEVPETVAEEVVKEASAPEIVAEETVEEVAETPEPGTAAEEVVEEAAEAPEPEIAAEESVEVAEEAAEVSEQASETPEPEIAAKDGNFFTKLFAGFLGKKDKQAEAPETVAETPVPEVVPEEAAVVLEPEVVPEEAAETQEPEIAAEEVAEEVSVPDVAAEETVEEVAETPALEDEIVTFEKLEHDFFIPVVPKESKVEVREERQERKLVERSPERRRDRRPRKRRRRRRKGISVAGSIVSGFFAAIAVLIMIGMGFGVSYVYGFVKDLPTHDLDEIEASLKVLSTIYDDEGNEMTDIFFSDSRREIVTFEQIPENLINAMVAVEDKTFWQHKGFNITRMLGALREAYTGGGDISGTSTITQQLARNIWLAETRSEYSLERKLKEAWFARELEQNLTKEEIMTHYLNMVALGNHSYGVAAAAKLYFNKDLSQLDLLECAALAALPQSPSRYAMIITVPPGEVDPNDPDILLSTDEYVFLYNEEAVPRIQLVLDLMYEQGYITEKQYNRASKDNIRRHLHPQPLQIYDNSSFFVNWMIKDVAEDMVRQYPGDFPDIDSAIQVIYSGGLEIYSTYSQRIQMIATEEFEDPKNYPVAYMVSDKSGNALSDTREVILYNYNNMFVNRAAPEETQEQALEGEDPDAVPSKFDLAGIGEPWFKLKDDEFEILQNGGMRIFAGKDKRLGIYKTSGDWGEDISVEFKDFFTKPPGTFYIVKGGKIRIPAEYKVMDGNGNLILLPDFFESKDNIFTIEPFLDKDGNPIDEVKENGAAGEYWIGPDHFILDQPVVQPQGATVILEYGTGRVKAMIGGRGIEGSMQYNRALSPRQPGSTMKPIGVYGPALQKTAEGIPVNDPEESFGMFWTAASIIYDEPLEYGGRVWPKNWYSGYRGPVTMRRAIEQSMNVCAVRSQLAVGNQRSIDFLKKLGITTIVETGIVNDLNPSALALGGMTQGIKPLELASAYSTFPNEGVHIDPIGYTKVLYKNGEVLLDGTPESEQVMDPGAAYIMTDMLRTTVQNGISNAGRIQDMEVAGKTGTTSENVDAWFAGSVNIYTAAVWIGNDTVIEMSKGSAAAAALFSKMMGRVCEGMEPVLFSERPMPPNVERGSVGGITDYFLIGTKPDTLSYGTKICKESGMLATPICPETERIALRPLNGHPASLTPEEIAAAEEGIPIWYCPLHNPDPIKYPVDPNPEPPPPPPPPPPVCGICGAAHDTSAHPVPVCGICGAAHETAAHPPDPPCVHGVSPPYACPICYPPPPPQCVHGVSPPEGCIICNPPPPGPDPGVSGGAAGPPGPGP